MSAAFIAEMRMAFSAGLGHRNAHAVIKGITTYDDAPRKPPRWRNLVNAYVEARGLSVFPANPGASTAHAFNGDTCLPNPGTYRYREGVRFEGWTYIRDEDGLAWSLTA